MEKEYLVGKICAMIRTSTGWVGGEKRGKRAKNGHGLVKKLSEKCKNLNNSRHGALLCDLQYLPGHRATLKVGDPDDGDNNNDIRRIN